MKVRSLTYRLIAFLTCIVCSPGVAVRGQQQQSPPIWDRSGVPTAQGAQRQADAAEKAGTQAQWERYSPAGEEFSALLPGRPFKSHLWRPQRMFEKERIGGWIYSSYWDGTVYIVHSFDNPKRREALEDFIDEFQKSHSKATFEREITLSGFKGKQYRATASSYGIRMITQFYLARDHAYIFEVVSDKTEEAPINKFLTSLTLDGKSKGKEIAEVSMPLVSPPATKSQPSSASILNEGGEQPEALHPKEVTRKAFIVMKPQPGYTEEARRHQSGGTVTLRAVLSSSGEVTNIRPTSVLPYGLTEKAILAARGVRFIPAVKDGHYVSQYVTFEYNYNLY